MLDKIRDVIVLPAEITSFEREYLKRVNRISVQFFVLHVPVFVAVAWFNDTRPWLAFWLTSFVAVGPVVARWLDNPRSVALVCGFAAMLMGALLVHFGQGPVQIEMHFYFFALLAMLALYGNPLAIVVAAVTVALHHLLLWFVLPSSVFNYAAPGWVVAVHAAFVVLESIATIFIARSFFDNVIGLEQVVERRTAELRERNAALRLVLDNIDEGLLSIDRCGVISPEYSAAIPEWFAAPLRGQTLEAFFRPVEPTFASGLAMGWAQCLEGVLPLEVSIDQMPSRLTYAGRSFRFGYRPLLDGRGALDGLLIVIGDATADVDRQRLQAEQQETLNIMDRVLADRAGFSEFWHEAEELLSLMARPDTDKAAFERALHTLKGNCMVFGARTVADCCHSVESELAESPPREAMVMRLNGSWAQLKARVRPFLGDREQRRIEVEPGHFDELLRAAAEAPGSSEVARMLAQLKLEPTRARLNRMAAQAQRIAKRLNKGGIDVQVDDSTLRLEPEHWASFWAAFVHVLRNAIDHGLEPENVRREAGKAGPGCVTLRTSLDNSHFVIEVHDDGQGIDWEKIAERAHQAGLPHATRDDLMQALFTDGITTANEVTEYSGRGLGLSAVYAACRERGGSVEVQSQRGAGTSFSFRFPLDEMAPTFARLFGSNAGVRALDGALEPPRPAA
jgi:two-component system, chemotaxis family, sensor kinase CheA